MTACNRSKDPVPSSGSTSPNTKLTDAAMQYLLGLTQMQKLDLSSTQVDDAGLGYFEGMSDLNSLNLENTKVTSVGMEYLQEMTSLQTLNLANTQVSDPRPEICKTDDCATNPEPVQHQSHNPGRRGYQAGLARLFCKLLMAVGQPRDSRSDQAMMSLTTLPSTSVRRKSRPAWRYVRVS